MPLRIGSVLHLLLAVVCVPVAGFLLLFGVANLVHPDVPASYATQNALVCSAVSLLGLALVGLALWSLRRALRGTVTRSGAPSAPTR